MRQGIQFFIIQIAGVIQYQMINFLIIRNYGSSEVTAYNIAYRYFSVLMLIWGILTVPIWSAVTDAYTRKDYAWIRRIIYRYVLILGLFYIGGFLMLGFSNFAYHIWIGDKVHVSLSLSVWVMLYNFMMMFCNIFVSITNGCGKLKLQSYACLISPIIFLFCCYYLINIGLGPYSILIAAIICNLNGFVLAPIQCYKIINEKRC